MSPSSLLKEAFDLHYSKRFADALAKYRTLVATYPESEEAIVARMQMDNLSPHAVASATGKMRTGSAAPGAARAVAAVFDCARCKCSIRLPVPAAANTFRCPNCQHTYTVVTASCDPLVLVLVPEPIREIVHAKPRSMPPHVIAAFEVLECEPTYDLPAVRQRYHSLIAQYHPDKVTHLGTELKRVAHEKTTMIVGAYATVGEFLKS